MKVEMLKSAQYATNKYLRCGEVYDLSLALPEDTRHALEEAAKLPWLTRVSGQMDVTVEDLAEASLPEAPSAVETTPHENVRLARRG